MSIRKNFSENKKILIFSLPACVIGLIIFLYLKPEWSLKPFLGALLAVSTILRLIKSSRKRLEQIIQMLSPVYLFFMGLIHGVSNLGGALITLYASIYFKNKKDIREMVAFSYFVMGSFQLIVLFFFRPTLFSWEYLAYPFVSILVYQTLGKYCFKHSAEGAFDRMMTILMGIFSVILLMNL